MIYHISKFTYRVAHEISYHWLYT